MRIAVVNLTNFFNRELFMYSLGDIKFKKPIALKKVAYMTLFFIVWTLPLMLFFGLPGGPISAIIYFVIPVVAGNIASKPLFGGKGLVDFAKTTAAFAFSEPKSWTDFDSNNAMDEGVFYVENEIWIGRRRELEMLAKTLDRTAA